MGLDNCEEIDRDNYDAELRQYFEIRGREYVGIQFVIYTRLGGFSDVTAGEVLHFFAGGIRVCVQNHTLSCTRRR